MIYEVVAVELGQVKGMKWKQCYTDKMYIFDGMMEMHLRVRSTKILEKQP